MENKQFTSNELCRCPCSNKGFQTDRFSKTTNSLNIPDTILENCSTDLSGESLKGEVPKIRIESSSSSENKENVSDNQQVKSNDLLNSSAKLAIDSLDIKQCENKLLEISFSDEEKSSELENKSLVNRHLAVQSTSAHHNDTISTPPSMLRKEISMLRKEMAEAHEFHDFEMKVLQEEISADGVESEKYIELFEKYSALVELYQNLKSELDECRKNQETVRNELQSKTADYLESLCSQIETSDNSLNFSSSFVSFSGGIKSSTIMEEASEVEASVVHDGTVLAKDPLSITVDNSKGTFKTPSQTPLRSAKKLFPESSSSRKKESGGAKDLTAKRDLTLDPEYNIHLLNLETAFYDKVKEVENLEQRLFKVEDMSLVLHSEFERITSFYAKENKSLKEELLAKTEQLNDLMQKLFTETISLNPSLRDSLIDSPGTKLLGVFLETIMENCKKIKNDDHLTTIENLRSQMSSQETKLSELDMLRTTCEELEAKLSDARSKISTREEEIKILQSRVSIVRQTQEDLASAKDTLAELGSKLKVIEAEKTAVENKCLDLEKARKGSQTQLELVQEEKSQIQKENARLRESQDSLRAQMLETEAILKSQESDMIAMKESLISAESSVQQLKSQLKSIADEKAELRKLCEQLQSNQSLQREVNAAKNPQSNLAFDKVQAENEYLKQQILESEKRLSELKMEVANVRKREVEELMREVEEVKKQSSGYSQLLENVERAQKLLAELLSQPGSDSDLPSERITKLMQGASNLQDSPDEREKKIMSLFVETITKTCKNVQNELIRNFDGEKLEWEDQRNLHLKLIKKLEEDVKLLGEKRDEGEARLREAVLEKEDLKKVHESLKNQMTEAERVVSTYNEEIKTLRCREEVMKKAKEDLSEAEEVIARLNDQLLSVKAEKYRAEQRCRELEESLARIQVDNNEKEVIVKELAEMKITKEKLENECNDLKRQILKSEEAIVSLEKALEGARKEHSDAEVKLKRLKSEIDLLKKERETFSDRLQNAEASNTQLRRILSDVQSHLDIPEKTLAEVLSGNVESRKVFSERINDLIKAQVEEKKEGELSALETNQVELEGLRKACKSLEVKLSEAKNTISSRDEEVRLLQTNVRETQDEFASTKMALSELRAQMESNEKEFKETENRCRELEAANENLKIEVENLRKDLQDRLSDAKEKLVMENDLRESCDALKTKIIEAQRTVSEREEEIRKLKAKESALEVRVEEMRKACELLNAELAEAKSRISAQEEKVKTLQTDVSEARLTGEELALAKETLTDLNSKLKEIEAEKAEAQKRSQDLERAVENLKREADASQSLEKELQARLSSALQRRSEAEEESSRLKVLHEALTSEMLKIASEHSEEIKLLKSSESSQENKLQAAKMTCENLRAKLLEAVSTISFLDEEIKVLKAEAERNQEEISATKSLMLELTSQLTMTEANKAETEKRCQELEKVIGNLKQEIAEGEKLQNQLKTQKSDIEKEMIQLEESYGVLKARMTEAENVISSREEEIRALRSYESQFSAIKENLVSADETILKLKSQLKSAEDEKSEMENRCSVLQASNETLRTEITSAKSLENNPVYEKIRSENNDLKQRMSDYEQMVSYLDSELAVAKENQRSNILKVEELIREIDELKRINSGFSNAFVTIEETQKNLENVLSDVGNDGDLPGDRVTKVMLKKPKASKASDSRETKIVSDFVETVSKTFKGVQSELIRKFDDKKLELETQRDADLQNLREQVKLLAEKNEEQMVALKKMRDDLASANDLIQKLKSELSSALAEKDELGLRCRKLEEGAQLLQGEIDTKDTIIKGLDELKVVREKLESENGDLKKQVVETEEVVLRLKRCLKIAQEEQTDGESRLKEIETEIYELKKEKETLVVAGEKLKHLEKSHKSLLEVLSDVQSHLDLPDDTLAKLLSEEFKNKKIFIDRINGAIRTQMDGLKVENKNLKLGNDSLRDRVKQLTKIIEETAGSEPKEDFSNSSTSLMSGMNLRNKSVKRVDRYARRLDKLEEINHNLTDLLIRILTTTEYPDLEKLNLASVREFSKTMKKVLDHLNGFLSNVKELKEENGQLDEECETYSNIIKDLKKEAAAVWKSNTERTEAMESEISRLKEEKNSLESERQDLLAKLSKLDDECQKLQSVPKTESQRNCGCGIDSKKINELKRVILLKEQKLLELQDVEAQSSTLKSQMEYLKTALEREKRKAAEEREKNKKLQNQLIEATKNEKKKSEENQVLEELRMRGSISGGIVQEIGDKEKMRKLSKDIGILKELCRARYAEIKRLEAVNAALRNASPRNASPKHSTTHKNSNQMDSPIRSRGYNTRSKYHVRDVWKTEILGKENSGV